MRNPKVQASTEANNQYLLGLRRVVNPRLKMENPELDCGEDMANSVPWTIDPTWGSAQNQIHRKRLILDEKVLLELIDVNCLVRASLSAVGSSLGGHMGYT